MVLNRFVKFNLLILFIRHLIKLSVKHPKCVIARMVNGLYQWSFVLHMVVELAVVLYHSQSIEAFFTHAPGLKVVVPSNPYDAKGLLKAAIRDPNPVLYLEPKKGYRLIKGEVPDEDYVVPIGPANISNKVRTFQLFAYGMMHYYALQSAQKLAEEGISAEVIDLTNFISS